MGKVIHIIGLFFILPMFMLLPANSSLAATETELAAASPSKPENNFQRAFPVDSVTAKAATPSASKILNVDVRPQVVMLQADGLVDNFKYFSLSGPERLVIDVFGVKPGFDARYFSLQEGFSSMRVGVYNEKLRFVFDASGKFPKYSIVNYGGTVIIRWRDNTAPTASP